MSKKELQSSGKHRRCGFTNGRGVNVRRNKTHQNTVLAGNHWYSILFCGKLF